MGRNLPKMGRNLSKMGRNLFKIGRNLCGTKSVKNGTKSVWDEICQNSTWDGICHIQLEQYRSFSCFSFVTCLPSPCHCVTQNKELINRVLANSSRSLRPVSGRNNKLVISCELYLYQLNDLNVVNQVRSRGKLDFELLSEKIVLFCRQKRITFYFNIQENIRITKTFSKYVSSILTCYHNTSYVSLIEVQNSLKIVSTKQFLVRQMIFRSVEIFNLNLVNF